MLDEAACSEQKMCVYRISLIACRHTSVGLGSRFFLARHICCFALYLRYICDIFYQHCINNPHIFPYTGTQEPIPEHRNPIPVHRNPIGTPKPHTGTPPPRPYVPGTPEPPNRTKDLHTGTSEHRNPIPDTGTPYRIPEHRNPIPEHRNPIPEPEHSVELQCTYTSFIGGRGGRVAVRPSATSEGMGARDAMGRVAAVTAAAASLGSRDVCCSLVWRGSNVAD